MWHQWLPYQSFFLMYIYLYIEYISHFWELLLRLCDILWYTIMISLFCFCKFRHVSHPSWLCWLDYIFDVLFKQLNKKKMSIISLTQINEWLNHLFKQFIQKHRFVQKKEHWITFTELFTPPICSNTLIHSGMESMTVFGYINASFTQMIHSKHTDS